MSYNILPNIILIFSVLGIILIILRHLPEAQQMQTRETLEEPSEKLKLKGLPAEAASKAKTVVVFWSKKVWNYALEAKDLKPAAATGYKIRKIFRHHPSQQLVNASETTAELTPEPIKDENYFLERIKLEPKNYHNYDALGRYYLERGNFADAKDIYSYLVNHEPASADYHSRLAACHYKLKEFDQAVDEYKKSTALDSTQPNRYYNLGLSLEAKGEYIEAAEALSKAIAIEPDNVKYYLSLSTCQNKLGQKDEAKSTLRTVLEKDPNNEIAKKRLEQIQ